MVAAPTPTKIAQSLVLGHGLPGFAEVPPLSEVQKLLRPGGRAPGWGPAAEDVQRWSLGIRGAIIWMAARRFVEDPESWFALPKGIPSLYVGGTVSSVGSWWDASSVLEEEFSSAVLDVVRELAVDPEWELVLRSAYLFLSAVDARDLTFEGRASAGAVATMSFDDVAYGLAGSLVPPITANAKSIIAPSLSVYGELGSAADPADGLAMIARSLGVLDEMAGLTVPLSQWVGRHMRRDRLQLLRHYQGEWHPDWVEVDDRLGGRLVPSTATGRPRIADVEMWEGITVGSHYRQEIEADKALFKVHAGCPASMRLAAHEGGFRSSALRMIALRIARTVTALASSMERGEITPRIAAPYVPPVGPAALEDVQRLDQRALSQLAVSGERKAAIGRCPIEHADRAGAPDEVGAGREGGGRDPQEHPRAARRRAAPGMLAPSEASAKGRTGLAGDGQAAPRPGPDRSASAKDVAAPKGPPGLGGL